MGFFTAVMALIIAVLFVVLGEAAFERIGFTSAEFTLILGATLVGSLINVPVRTARSSEPVVEVREVRVFGLTYRIPAMGYREASTVIAVNVGGALVPVVVSVVLLGGHPGLIPEALGGSVVTAVLVHLMARKVKGVGIVTPALLPPLAAAAVAYLVAPGSPAIVAYISGTLGALVGADLTNMRGITRLGAPMASIGGAGTFDGVFLTGLVAVILVPLL